MAHSDAATGQSVEFDGKYADVIIKGDTGEWRFSLIIGTAMRHREAWPVEGEG